MVGKALFFDILSPRPKPTPARITSSMCVGTRLIAPLVCPSLAGQTFCRWGKDCMVTINSFFGGCCQKVGRTMQSDWRILHVLILSNETNRFCVTHYFVIPQCLSTDVISPCECLAHETCYSQIICTYTYPKTCFSANTSTVQVRHTPIYLVEDLVGGVAWLGCFHHLSQPARY